MKPCIPDRLPIKDIEWEPLIPLIGKANRAIAYFDGILYGISEPEVLLSPLTTQEAVISSKIEGTHATLGEVFRFEAGEIPEQESRRLDMEEIINYRRAMSLAQEELKTRPFSLNMLKRLHEVLLTGVRGRDKAKGQFRTIQNWIGAPNTPIDKADFVPPEPGVILEYLDNWERYYHILDRPDPLVQLAIIHAQFEVIHPFLDGNGRIGRMIIPLFLFEKKYLSKPMFYIATYMEEHRDEYIARLRALCSEKDAWNKWIEFFLIAVSEQAKINSEKARNIIELYEKLKVRVLELTHSQFAIPLLDNMFTTPIFSSNAFRKPLPNNPTRATTLGLLNTLKQAGILKVIREGAGRRAQVLAFAELINLCEGKTVF